MASSHSAVRKALQGLEDGLSVFTQQLAAETAELRRNVENRPRTGATYYRNILEDLQQRAEGVGLDLAALEAVSTEAVSLEVGADGRGSGDNRWRPSMPTDLAGAVRVLPEVMPSRPLTIFPPNQACRSWWAIAWRSTARTTARHRSWRCSWRSMAIVTCSRRCRRRTRWTCWSWLGTEAQQARRQG